MDKQDIYTTIQQNGKNNEEELKKDNKNEVEEVKIEEQPQELDPPKSQFQVKLDEQLFPDVTLREYLFGIYKTVKEDRDRMKKLYDKIFIDFKPEEQPEINFLAHVNTYQKLMKDSNDQLIEMVKVIEKIVSASAKTESTAKQADGSVPKENFDNSDTWKFIAIEGGVK